MKLKGEKDLLTLYGQYADPIRSFIFEELQPTQDFQLFDSILVLVPSALIVSSVVVCIYYIRFYQALSIFVSRQKNNL